MRVWRLVGGGEENLRFVLIGRGGTHLRVTVSVYFRFWVRLLLNSKASRLMNYTGALPDIVGY